MKGLEYLTDASYACSVDNANVMAFVEAIAIIGGRDVVEEFLACGVWPLSSSWDFSVEMRESPLSKVTVPMPQVTVAIGEKEMPAAFEAQIVIVVNVLIGNYSMTESISLAQCSFDMVDSIRSLSWPA
jgi:hypothetical protein